MSDPKTTELFDTGLIAGLPYFEHWKLLVTSLSIRHDCG